MPDPLRVAIVDDEPLAREGLRLRLEAAGGVSVVLEEGDATEAARSLPDVGAEVLFLDIQMPELDGFGLLDRLGRRPLPVIVFVTAHSEHAARAFRTGAVDYLVKPYDDETLREALGRARERVAAVRSAVLASDAAEEYPERLVLRSGREVVVARAEDIRWLESAGDRVRVHVATGTALVRVTMDEIGRRLDPRRFVRIHRTAIVAIPEVRALEPYSRDEHVVVLRDGTRLPLSRRYRARVLDALAEAGGAPVRRSSRG